MRSRFALAHFANRGRIISASRAPVDPAGACVPIVIRNANDAPVAQLDRALVSGTRGQEFKSPQARHPFSFSFNQVNQLGAGFSPALTA